jgi:signal transduction histidine kinase
MQRFLKNIPGRPFSLRCEVRAKAKFETLPFRETMVSCFLRDGRGSTMTLRPGWVPLQKVMKSLGENEESFRILAEGLVGKLSSEIARVLREKVQTIEQTVDETVQTVRAIATQLRPSLLDDLGLAAAIEWQAKDFQKRSGILCALTLPGEDPHLSRDQATAIFRIFQEILTNVTRHSQATKVWVHLGTEHEAIVLEVEDNGVGISPAQLAERRSLGLLGMRERAGAFGGGVEIVGSSGQGTTVTVQMPLLKKNDKNLDR